MIADEEDETTNNAVYGENQNDRWCQFPIRDHKIRRRWEYMAISITRSIELQ